MSHRCPHPLTPTTRTGVPPSGAGRAALSLQRHCAPLVPGLPPPLEPVTGVSTCAPGPASQARGSHALALHTQPGLHETATKPSRAPASGPCSRPSHLVAGSFPWAERLSGGGVGLGARRGSQVRSQRRVESSPFLCFLVEKTIHTYFFGGDTLPPDFLFSLEWLTVSAVLENSLDRRASPGLLLGPWVCRGDTLGCRSCLRIGPPPGSTRDQGTQGPRPFC